MKVTDNSQFSLGSKKNILSYPIQKYRIDHSKLEIEDDICHEGVLEIRVRKKNQSQFTSIAITMRTYGNDYELALGFLFTEGLIEAYSEVESYEIISNEIIGFVLQNTVSIDLNSATRKVFTSSSCGICSKGNKESLSYDSHYLSWSSKQQFKQKIIYGISQVFQSEDSIFSRTGANHAVALITESGELIEVYEDVGRHNAMDKLIGTSMKKNLFPLSNNGIILSGRISYELVQKAAMTGVTLIIALGAPSSLAIDEAFAQNICLIGFAKDQSFNVYSSFERII